MKKLSLFFLYILPIWVFSQQVGATNYHPPIPNPAYESSKGSTVFIDEGHHNFHTKDGRYQAFADLLERDGYIVTAYKGTFNKRKLEKGNILIISNALNEVNIRNWTVPTPSAFTPSEIAEVKTWVFEGGSLFLIADHMPMAGAAAGLAKAFGFEFTNGFALDTLSRNPATYFSLREKTLTESIITKGRNSAESVSRITTFTGQAFKIPPEATPILTFSDHFVNLLPDTAWVFNDQTTVVNPKGWSQGAYKKYGKGRVVVFGEAAMFTAQVAGPQKRKMGMNSEEAPQNYQLLLNIIHWLDGKLD